MSFDSRSFRKALGCFPTGVTVVTTRAGDGSPVGVTISSFSSLSLEPPLVMFALDHRNSNLESFRQAGHFAVNVLRQEQRELSIRFSSKLEDKWRGVTFTSWDSGAPILAHCLANFECVTDTVQKAGDHLLFIGRVERLEHSAAGLPLLHYRGGYAELVC
jgi:flavin reductase (DIM6/NTAB) family NADH-FMN oxidoreductase RutF